MLFLLRFSVIGIGSCTRDCGAVIGSGSCTRDCGAVIGSGSCTRGGDCNYRCHAEPGCGFVLHHRPEGLFCLFSVLSALISFVQFCFTCSQ
ncbi:hypothetical protein FKM82_005759 [Ascaphus truei]